MLADLVFLRIPHLQDVAVAYRYELWLVYLSVANDFHTT